MVDLQPRVESPSVPSQVAPPYFTAAEGAAFARRVRRRLTLGLNAATVDGALTVLIYLELVLPPQRGADLTTVRLVNLAVFVAYMVASVLFAEIWSIRRTRTLWQWAERGGPPSAEERAAAVRVPRDQALLELVLWQGAAVVFGLVNYAFARDIAEDVYVTIALAGLSVSALNYLIAERIMRPVVAIAFADAPPQQATGIGVLPRILLTWAFCTGIPLLGIGIAYIGVPHDLLPGLVVPTFFLVGVGLLVGLIGMVFAAKSVSEPLDAVRNAMAQVGAGRTDVRVAVDDMSEIGQLQAGFNDMLDGLRERQRLADLFGRQVGVDVAREALERGVSLGGEAREAAVLFVDIVGSTALAAQKSPQEVVERLNTFFAVVVDAVERHHGWVNKFEGDAALCVFGVPVARADAATCALAAARDLRERLQASGDFDVGVGVAAGTVIAGNVGAEHRYEYTVIGDPVNEAARLTELAKSRPERVVASFEAVARAEPDEAGRWRSDGEITLRGRPLTTRLAVPAA